jgi:hypothetical protein
MWVWMDRIGIVLFDAALSTAVFLTIIVLVMLACRQPVRRILLSRVALLASLAIIPLVAWGHLPRLYVIDTLVESPLFPKALFLAAAAVDPPDVGAEGLTEPDGPGRFVPVWLLERVAATRRWLPRGLTLVDLGCVAVGSSWLLLGLAGVEWLIRRSRPPSTATQALFDKLVAGRSGAAARARLRVCVRLRHPVVTGLFRPTILIPEVLDQADQDPEPLRLSLLHEIAHAERSDHWFSTAASVAQAVWFFLPHVWWIRSQLLIDQEFLADRSAAERYGTSSAEYATSLLLMAAPSSPTPSATANAPERSTATGAKTGRHSPLFQRIMMLLHCPYPVESRSPRVWSWTSRFAVILASIAAACLVIRWPQASHALPVPMAGAAGHTRFQTAHFVTEPVQDTNGTRRSRVYVLPVTLPSRFELDVDVRCSSNGLAQLRIVGQTIGIPGTLPEPVFADPPGSTPVDSSPKDWHHVHIHRDRHHFSIVVDGQDLPDAAHTDPSSDWLTIEPPANSSAEFRKLTVVW